MTYRAIGLPTTCSNCHLSNNKVPPIWGQAEIPLSKVKGIIISAYSGKEEEKERQVLVEAPNYLNAGGFLRGVLRSLTNDKEIDKYFFFTNAISCSTKNNKKEINSCIQQCSSWTQFEIAKCNPNVPILVASSEAVIQLFGNKASISKLRNEPNLTYGERPCVVTWNPITPLRYLPRNIDETLILPVPIYSPTWLFKQDVIRFLTLAEII